MVIENKVFSLPNEAQLARYAEAFAAEAGDPAFWLLSLIDPSWPGDRKILGGREWRWLSFPELASWIRQAIAPRDRSYAAETMRRYADVVDLLSQLAGEVVVSDSDSNERVAMPSGLQADLGERLASGALEAAITFGSRTGPDGPQFERA